MDVFDQLLLSNNYSHVLETREESIRYFQSHQESSLLLRDHFIAYHYIMNLIPETAGKLFSGHIFPYLESQIDLEASVHLLSMGFYKPALISLRSCLELGLLYIYYDRNDNSEEVIKDWMKSKEATPFKRTIIEGLTKIDNISTMNSRRPILEAVSKLYERLSNYVHTAGYKHSSRGLTSANFSKFDEGTVHKWLIYLHQTVSSLCILFLCKYPVGLHFTPVEAKFGLEGPIGSFLNPHEADRIRRCIDPSTLMDLSDICLKDKEAIAMAEWVNSHDDITSEEFEEQSEREDKRNIETWGYLKWLANMVEPITSKNDEFREYMRPKLVVLEAWAKASGFYEKGTMPDFSESKKTEP